jgi:hypothetical protein
MATNANDHGPGRPPKAKEDFKKWSKNNSDAINILKGFHNFRKNLEPDEPKYDPESPEAIEAKVYATDHEGRIAFKAGQTGWKWSNFKKAFGRLQVAYAKFESGNDDGGKLHQKVVYIKRKNWLT